MFKKRSSMLTAISVSILLGSSILPISQVHAQEISVLDKNDVDRSSDIDLANRYLKRHPDLAAEMDMEENAFRDRLKQAPASRRSALIADFNKDREADVLRFANQQRKHLELQEIKTGKDYKNMNGRGEPAGVSEAKRLALQCGPKENVGYTNYFGNRAFYSQDYPMVGPEIAHIEAIPILRYRLLPRLDKDLREFISNKQLTFKGQNFNRERRGMHSEVHNEGGQKKYVDSVYDMATAHNGRRSNKLTDNMLSEIYSVLNRPISGNTSYIMSGNNGPRRTGRSILEECRYFWAHNNTVKYLDPLQNNGFIAYRTQNRRIGIKPHYKLAEPVSRKGTPVAQIDLNKEKYNDQANQTEVSGRVGQYEGQLGSELKERSASDIIQQNIGDTNDPYAGSSMPPAQAEEYEDKSTSYEEYLENRRSNKKRGGLSFEDIYK